MRGYSLTHLGNRALLRRLAFIVSRDRRITAELLALLAEVDSRRLHVELGYPSMHAFCVGELHFSDDAAYKRIQAARAARRFSQLFAAVSEGRLHLTAVRLLAPHLTPDNVDDLIAEATHQRAMAIEAMLARRFPSSEPSLPPARVRVLPTSAPPRPRAAAKPGETPLFEPPAGQLELAPGQVGALTQETNAQPEEHFLLQVAIGKSTHDKLRYAQALLSHSIASGDIAAVLDRALEALIHQCEKRKFARTPRPRAARPAVRRRAIPASVRREVWARDGGRCTFVGSNGHRCATRRRLEYDHVVPVAHGGEATAERMRLRCRAHNQLEAERTFGRDFMKKKREAARRTTGSRRPGDSPG
jgi:5-methylcytosine-specific restriction endonuclease McrA